MPIILTEIPDVPATVTKQVLGSIVDEVLLSTGIDRSLVIFAGTEYTNNHQPNSTIGDETEVGFGNTRRIVVEVTETPDQESLNDRAVINNINIPFFNHPLIALQASTSHARMNVELSITYRDNSRSQVATWANEIKRRVGQGRQGIVSSANYHYRIPAPVLNLISDCYHAGIEKYPALGASLAHFLKEGFTDAVTVVTDVDGRSDTFAVRVNQGRILGYFDVSGEIRKEKANETGAWQATITYNFSYESPETVVTHHPLQVCNTWIPDQWWPDVLAAPGFDFGYEAERPLYVQTQEELNHITKRDFIELPIYVPEWNYIKPPRGNRVIGEFPLIVGSLTLDTSSLEPNTILFNIDELGEYGLGEHALDYIRICAAKSPHLLGCIFRVRLSNDKREFFEDLVTVDADLNVRTTYPLDIRLRFYFSLTILLDWTFLDEEGLDDLGKKPPLIWDIIEEFRPDIIDKYKPILPEIPDTGRVTWPVLDKVKDDFTINPNDPGALTPRSLAMFTVLIGRIIVRKDA